MRGCTVQRSLLLWRAALCTALMLAAGGATAQSTQPVLHARLTILHSFMGGTSDGADPVGGVIGIGAGDLYGATAEGGGTGCGGTGCGTVFKLAPHRTLTLLHVFAGSPSDGAAPLAGLIADSSGNLYGTTSVGGSAPVSGCLASSTGCGTVFSLSRGGLLTLLHSFTGQIYDGQDPQSGLMMDSSGNLYGTTIWGGGLSLIGGTVFKLSLNGAFTLLHSFTGGANDGVATQAGLIEDSSGYLYGTTSSTVFKLSSRGAGTPTVLHVFAGGANDGTDPRAGLFEDSSGYLYGTTYSGGGTGCGGTGCGTVFKLAPDGTSFTLLHSFAGDPSDGAFPLAGVLADASGNLYGTTSEGGGTGCGGAGCGVVFKLAPDGTLTLLHSFAGGSSDGAYPSAGLIFDNSGNLYGTTSSGGRGSCNYSYNAVGCGTVFMLTGTGFLPPPAVPSNAFRR